MSEDSLLERVTAAAEERQLSHNSLIAYRRTWLKIIALAVALLPRQWITLETVSGEFYEEATRGRSASHHLQVKAALAPLSRSRFTKSRSIMFSVRYTHQSYRVFG